MRTLALASALVLVLASLGSGLAGCGDSPEAKQVRKEFSEAWGAAKSWGVAKRADAEKLFAEQSANLKKSFEAAKAKASEAGGAAGQALESGWADVSQKLEAMKNASADQWEKSRDAFVAAYEAFQQKMSAPK